MNTLAYQYVVLRCVPRVEREEFINVGVVLYCQVVRLPRRPLERRPRPAARSSTRSSTSTRCARRWRSSTGVCAGDQRGGTAAEQPIGTRFGFLMAPRSTVLQPGPVHGGVTADPAAELERLLGRLVTSER